MNNIKIFKEKTGLEYILVPIPNIESCAISVMIRTGTIYETKQMKGGAHLLEHVLFRGNDMFSTQRDLSLELDSIGARYNAYTDSGIVSFHIKVQKKYLEKCIHILGNMIATSLLRPNDINEEKLIVCQELEKDLDDPVKHTLELIHELVFKGNNYSEAVGGNIESVKKIDPKALKEFWKSNYNSNNIVLSIAGNIDENKTKEIINTSPFLKDVPDGKINQYTKVPTLQKKIRYNYDVRPNMNQVQLCIGFPTFSNKSNDKFILDVIKVILAGPMSSRLFGKMRNDYGIAYNVGCHTDYNSLSGCFIIGSGVDGSGLFSNTFGNGDGKKKADPIKVILTEVFRFIKEKVSMKELNMAKEYMKGNLLLETEDTEVISQFYGKMRVIQGDVFTFDTYMQELDSVTPEDIQRVANDIFKPHKMNISMVGNIKPNNLKEYIKQLPSIYKYAL